MRVTKKDYQRYGVHIPIYQYRIIYLFLMIFLAVIDFCTVYSNIDLAYQNTDSNMNIIVSLAEIFVIDVVPMVMCEALTFSKNGKKVLPWAGMTLIFCAIVFMLIQRYYSSDIAFAQTDVHSSLLNASEVQTEAEPYQKILNLLIGFLPLITTIFGMVLTLRRGKVRRQMTLVKNKMELLDLITQRQNLENSLKTDLSAHDQQAYQNACQKVDSIRNLMISEKNDALAKYLGDAKALAYISAVPLISTTTVTSPTSKSVSTIPLVQTPF